MMSGAAPIFTVRADCSSAIGYGHVMRCLSVARSLNRDGGARVRFMIAADSDATPIRTRGVEIRQLGATGLAANDLIAEIDPEDGPVLLDSYDVHEDTLDALRTAGFRVAMFDDGKRLNRYPCEMVVDSAPAAANLAYTGLPTTRFCLGADYFPLRDEFLRLDRPHAVRPVVRTIVVTFGGSDHDDITARAIGALAGVDGDFRIVAILGPAYRGAAESAAERDPRVHLHRNPANIEALLGSADIAVTAGGGTASELAFLGVPMIMLALSVDQAYTRRIL